MTWILMKIPCCFVSQIDGSLVEIGTKFHDYSMSFIQILFVIHAQTWHGFWISSSHGISMAFAEKMMGFASDLMSFLSKLPSKRHGKIRVTFFTGQHAFIFRYSLSSQYFRSSPLNHHSFILSLTLVWDLHKPFL